jgi:hypothetical protein
MQVDQLFVKGTQTYSKMEPAFTQCDGKDYIIPYALGAVSRVIGECQQRHGDSGTCWGTFHSRDVDTRDTPWGCIANANDTASVCRVGAVSGVAKMTTPPTANPNVKSNPVQSSQQNAPELKTLKNFNRAPNTAQNQRDAAQKFANAQAANLRMSYDVYDSPFLKYGTQSTSDPAGWLTGIPTYNNLRQQAEQTSLLPEEPFGTCSSYGNYSNCPNCTLTSNNRCASGTCVLGQKA